MNPSGGMQLNDQQTKSAYIAVACLFLLSAIVVPPRLNPARATQTDAQPLPLGTKELKIGMDLYAASNNFHFGTIVELDRFHEFPDGSIRPAALMRRTNGFKVWIPAEKMAGMMVVQ